ncbi:DUF4191 domain-containing protein [Herbidospora mongoliensis]|uniref:DUF4191 domain-containing protein n=1 Tax=Herbidospora mongoliensis TaxID=688067 RepID=UPI00082A6F9E|nr:DUF4191 domain-containing protein [Herbidospora mongoliensis]
MAKDSANPGRIKQLRMVAQIIKKANPKGMPLVYLTVVGVIALAVVIGLLTGAFWYVIILGIPVALLAGMLLFGRFAQRAQYSMLHGQPGAVYAILQGMRGNWMVEEKPVAVNREQDLVFRLVGYPGVILVSEGPGTRVQKMLVAEKKRVQRVAIDVPVYDVQCGDAEGQVPLAKLQRHLMKLPRNLKKPAVSEVNNRMRALTPSIPMPKGPLPKGARLPKGVRPR